MFCERCGQGEAKFTATSDTASWAICANCAAEIQKDRSPIGIPGKLAVRPLKRCLEGTAYWIKQLINELSYARQLGLNGREQIKNNFLITRHIKDYLLEFLSLVHKREYHLFVREDYLQSL